ncbi:protein of unknown function [Pseudomonas mediterranea]
MFTRISERKTIISPLSQIELSEIDPSVPNADGLRKTELWCIGAAAQPSGDKSPRHSQSIGPRG